MEIRRAIKKQKTSIMQVIIEGCSLGFLISAVAVLPSGAWWFGFALAVVALLFALWAEVLHCRSARQTAIDTMYEQLKDAENVPKPFAVGGRVEGPIPQMYMPHFSFNCGGDVVETPGPPLYSHFTMEELRNLSESLNKVIRGDAE